MRPESGNEMERIQKGLEEFLDQEVEEIRREGKVDYSGSAANSNFWNTPFDDSDLEEEDAEWDDETEDEEEDVMDDGSDDENDEDEDEEDDDEEDDEAEDEIDERNSWKENASGMKKNKKKSRLFSFVLKLAVILAFLFLGLYLCVGVVYPKMNYRESTALADGGLKEEGVTSILLIGSDSRTTGNEGRSDAMILVTISDRTKTVRMTSLLRDMYVEIPGHDGNRLNAAYAYGGPELLLETIRHNFGVEVYRYAVVNFSAFAGLVDAAEGVELEISNEEVQWINAFLNEYNELRGMPMETDYLDTSLSGKLHLNGAQALAYSRNRFIGSDFGRTERQRKVLSAVLAKLPTAVIKNPRQLINGLFPNLTTNLTRLECTRLCTAAPKLLLYDAVQDRVPLDGTYSNASIRGMSVLQVDLERNREYIAAEVYGE